MSKVSLLDQNFKTIIDYLSNPSAEISTLTLSQSLQSFRKQINFNWYSQFLQYDHISYLTEIWDALFQLLAHNVSEDPGLRIPIFKTLGALIYTLSPFIPFSTVSSFLSSIQNKPSNPHLSIAIIACFCYISQFVSPLNFDSFISKSPIIQCFSDLKQSKESNNPQNQSYYVKYLPKIISNAKPLNKEFQRFLLSALLNTFGENPTLPFIFAIIELLKNAIDSKILIDDLLKYIEQRKKQRKLTLLMISPYLLENKKCDTEEEITQKNFIQIHQYFNDKIKEDLFDLAISTILQDAPNVPSFSEFEEACRTLTALLEKMTFSKLIEKINKIKEVLGQINCPPYLKIYTLPFIDSIDELTPKEDDKLSIITAKLSALSNFLMRSPTTENFESIFKIFVSFLQTESKEILTNLINAVSKCFSIVTVETIRNDSNSPKVGQIRNYLKILLEEFFNIKTSNFVQNVTIVNLIQFVDFDLGDLLIPNYRKISFHIVFNFCFSLQNNLSETAINVLKSIIQYRTVSDFVSLVFDEVDFFDAFSLFKICEISNVLIEEIGYQTVTELRCLVDPIFESLTLIHRTSSEFSSIIRTESEAFSFFNKVQEAFDSFNSYSNEDRSIFNEKQENELKLICFDLIGRIFESFTGIAPLLPTISPPLQPITSLIETDILLKSFDDQTYFMKAMKECMVFLRSMKSSKSQKDLSNDKFTELLIRLMKILPEESLKFLQSLKSSYFVDSDSYHVLLLDIMKTTNSISVASQCALASSSSNLMEQQIRLFVQSQQKISNSVLHKIKMYKTVCKFIGKKLILGGRIKYNFFQYIKKVHSICNEVNEKKDKFDESLNLPEVELDSPSENVLFSFLETEDKIEFIKNVGFHSWPLFDKEFNIFIMKNQDKIGIIGLDSFDPDFPNLNKVCEEMISKDNKNESKDKINENEDKNENNENNEKEVEGSENGSIRELNHPFSLTYEEIKFIATNWQIFDKEVIKQIKENYGDSFQKLFNEEAEIYINANRSNSFKFNFPIKQTESSALIGEQNVTLSNSILEHLHDSSAEFTFSVPLVKKFFLFESKLPENNVEISDETYNRLLSVLVEECLNSRNVVNSFDLNPVINYAILNSITIDFDLIKKMLNDNRTIRYINDISVYLTVMSNRNPNDNNIEQLNSFLSNLVSSKIKEENKDDWFTHYLFELLNQSNEFDCSSVKAITSSLTSCIWSFAYCRCCDFDYYQYIASKIYEKKKIVDSKLVLSSFDYFNELKTAQNSSFFKSGELLRNSVFFISNYFNWISSLNKVFSYSNEKINKNFLSFLKNFSKTILTKAEFLVNSNFNLFSLNAESRSNLLYFLRLIDLYLYNIHALLLSMKETISNSKSESNDEDEVVDTKSQSDKSSQIHRLENEIFDEIDKFVRTLVYFFHAMLESDCLMYVIAHREIGRILSLILLLSNFGAPKQDDEKSHKRILIDDGQIIDLIDKITNKCGIYSFSCFFEPSSLLLSLSPSKSNPLFTSILKKPDRSIVPICKFGNMNTFVKIPSDCLAVLRSLMILINPELIEILINHFFYTFYPSIVDVFRIFAASKIAPVDIMIEKVVRRLLSNQQFHEIQNQVLPYLEQYAREQTSQESKKEFGSNFGVSIRIIDLLEKVKIL